MTPFQQLLVKEVTPLLPADSIFREIRGKTETYFIASTRINNRLIEIYAYGKEGGIMLDGADWVPLERVDYDSDPELIQDLKIRLSKLLDSAGKE